LLQARDRLLSNGDRHLAQPGPTRLQARVVADQACRRCPLRIGYRRVLVKTLALWQPAKAI
jgi:hypothetical protein